MKYSLNGYELSTNEYEALYLQFGSNTKSLEFDDENDISYQSEVIGCYKALEIIWAYGLDESQDFANELGINEPLRDIESLASFILERIIIENAEELEMVSCDNEEGE